MSEQPRLPIVTENDMLMVLADEATTGGDDPYYKEWFRKFAADNPILAGEILHRLSDEIVENPELFNKLVKIVGYTIHSLEIAQERLDTGGHTSDMS